MVKSGGVGDLPLKKTAGGNTSMLAEPLTRLVVVVFVSTLLGNFCMIAGFLSPAVAEFLIL